MKSATPGKSGRLMKDALDKLYEQYNRPEHIHPDPLEFVHLYANGLDREVAGFIASALAYGRVRQIHFSVSAVLDRMGPSPSSFLLQNSASGIRDTFHFFKHRFTTGAVLAALLEGLKKLIDEYGSLESCFLRGFDPAGENILPALSDFVRKLDLAAGRTMPMFLPSPSGGSACKRLNLFLRWMVRRDNVDPGVWRGVSPSHLVIPLDTHMHRIALALGLTERKQADLRCAVEVTGKFARICPEDPVRYDFALTRFAMNNVAPLNAIPGLRLV
ncbi:MAG: TIGR02757 family protein [Syntrophobacteraceae bacterium]